MWVRAPGLVPPPRPPQGRQQCCLLGGPSKPLCRPRIVAGRRYFVQAGTVQIQDAETGRALTQLTRGSHFGEMGLLAYCACLLPGCWCPLA